MPENAEKPTTTVTTTAKPVWRYRQYVVLTPHRNGQWCKRINGRLHYFGPVEDQEAAYREWLIRGPDLLAGRTGARRTVAGELVTLKDLGNHWCASVAAKVRKGERSQRTYEKYVALAKLIAATLGQKTIVQELTPRHFQRLSAAFARFSLVRRSDLIAGTKSMFNWGVGAEMLKRVPAYGPDFRQPEARDLRAARHAAGSKALDREVILRLIAEADPHLRACILLGINCGFKATDCATLTRTMLNLDKSLIDGYRHKTHQRLLAPLWPETVAAIRAVAAPGKMPLVTATGLPWVGRGTSRLTRQFRDLCDRLGLPAEVRHDRLRHTLRTVGGQVSREGVRRIMGQGAGDVLDETYDHDPMLVQCRAVAEHVRRWLYGV